MRLRQRWFAVLAIAGLLWWQWPMAVGQFDRAWGLVSAALERRRGSSTWKLTKVPESLVGKVYLLDPESWLTFDLPPDQPMVRLLTSGDLPAARRPEFGSPIPATVVWTYAVRTELLDSRGNVLDARDQHFQTRLSEFADPKVGADVTPAFYLGESVIPADSRMTVVPLAGYSPHPTRLRVRLLKADDPLAGVTVQVLYPDPVSELKLSYFWNQMPEDRKRKMARGNVYGLDLLTGEEKENLLRHRWSPVAPRGQAGADYRQRDMYFLTEAEGNAVRDRPPPAGVPAEPGRVAVIPIPEEAGPIRFVCKPLEAGKAAAAGAEVEFRWYGPRLTDRETFRVPWTGREAVVHKTLPGGTVEVYAPQPLFVRAYWAGVAAGDRRRPPGSEEITPIRTLTWSYLVRGDSPVDFEVLHAAGEATPVRVDVRRLSTEPDLSRTGLPNPGAAPQPVPPLRVPYQFLDASGAVVQGGELLADEPASAYDRVQLLRQEFAVSDPNSYYFSAPPRAVRLRFPGAGLAAVVTVYNRPGDLDTLTRVPEDYFHFNRTEAQQRSWFLFRSPDHDRLEVANRVPIVIVQTRPPEDDPEIVAGRFEWFEFLPRGDWRGRPLLVLRDLKAPFRVESLATTYLELAPGHDTQVRFLAEPGRSEVIPSLAYLREGEAPFTVRLTINGRTQLEARADGARGEILLPAVPVPKGGADVTARVTTSKPARLFLNYADPGTRPALVKRTAVHLTGPHEFEYEKADHGKRAKADEVLSLTVFRPIGATDRLIVRVRIERAGEAALGPFLTWTFRRREYDVRPAGGDPVPVLGTRDLSVDAGQPFVFPVGEDLPPGKYRIRIEPVGGRDAYMFLNRSIPGAYDKRDFFQEQPGRVGPPVEREP